MLCDGLKKALLVVFCYLGPRPPNIPGALFKPSLFTLCFALGKCILVMYKLKRTENCIVLKNFEGCCKNNTGEECRRMGIWDRDDSFPQRSTLSDSFLPIAERHFPSFSRGISNSYFSHQKSIAKSLNC